MMGLRLALYSDQVIPANADVNQRLLKLIGVKYPRIGYVSSAPDPSRAYFAAKKTYYAAIGAELCTYVDSENAKEKGHIVDLLKCDAIHLTGGDTYAFLAWLQETDTRAVLREYALNSGVLIGTSAGSLLMAQNIAIAELVPHPTRHGPRCLDALGLVDFQFWPHYRNGQENSAALSSFLSGAPLVYGCPDGAGVIVDQSVIETIGEVKVFRYGRLDT